VADGRAGVFLFAHGPVSVQAGGMASAVVRGTVVHEGDVVETGPGGRAQLRMVDGAMIDLEPGSTLRLAEYQLAAQPANHRSLLELVRGGLRTLTGVIGQQNQPGYELRVRTVTIGVRGTEYRTELQGEQVVLDVLQGRVALCNPAGCVDVARGESARAPLSGALPARTAAATVPGGAAAGAATPGAALPTVPHRRCLRHRANRWRPPRRPIPARPPRRPHRLALHRPRPPAQEGRASRPHRHSPVAPVPARRLPHRPTRAVRGSRRRPPHLPSPVAPACRPRPPTRPARRAEPTAAPPCRTRPRLGGPSQAGRRGAITMADSPRRGPERAAP